MIISALAIAAAANPLVETAAWPPSPNADTPTAQIRQAGSIAKYVCTLAALRMENEGLLSLDAPVARLLPGYTGPQR